MKQWYPNNLKHLFSHIYIYIYMEFIYDINHDFHDMPKTNPNFPIRNPGVLDAFIEETSMHRHSLWALFFATPERPGRGLLQELAQLAGHVTPPAELCCIALPRWVDEAYSDLVSHWWAELFFFLKIFYFSISNMFYCLLYMGCHPSHWRTPSFFKMVKLLKSTNQITLVLIDVLFCWCFLMLIGFG